MEWQLKVPWITSHYQKIEMLKMDSQYTEALALSQFEPCLLLAFGVDYTRDNCHMLGN